MTMEADTASFTERVNSKTTGTSQGWPVVVFISTIHGGNGGPRLYSIFSTELKLEPGDSNLGRPHFIFLVSYFLVFVPVLLQLVKGEFGLGVISRRTLKVLVAVSFKSHPTQLCC